ncbi:hypothetical protein GN956_G24349 [Arapaima gigas]
MPARRVTSGCALSRGVTAPFPLSPCGTRLRERRTRARAGAPLALSTPLRASARRASHASRRRVRGHIDAPRSAGGEAERFGSRSAVVPPRVSCRL